MSRCNAERLASINDEMQQASDGSGKTTNLLHRHREILADKQSEFKRTRAKINSQRQSHELLSSVRKDITCALAHTCFPTRALSLFGHARLSVSVSGSVSV